MSGPLVMIYSEYAPDRPPLAWWRGELLPPDHDRSQQHRFMGKIAANARTATRGSARALRPKDVPELVLLETETQKMASDGQVRVVVVVQGRDHDPVPEFPAVAKVVAEVLAGVGVPLAVDHFAADLEWGWRSSAGRFPRLSAFFRRCGARLGRERGASALQEAGLT